MACGTRAGRVIGVALGVAALLAGSATLWAEEARPAAATSQSAEGRDSLTVRYGCKFRGTATRVIVHKDGKDLELSRDKVSAVALSPDKVTLAGEVPCDCTLVAVRFSTATDPAHVALFKRKDITAIALDFPSAAASQPGEVGFSRERSADEVDKDLLRTNSELLATRLAAAKETSKKALATIAADYDSKITAAQTNVNEANAKLQTAAASAANSQVAANNAAAQAAHTGGGAHMMALQEQRMAQRAYDKAAKDGQAAQKSLNGAKAELQTLTTQKDADMARVSSQSSALEPALHDVLNMHAMVLFFGGTLSAADMEANFAAEGTAAPAAAPPPAKDPAPAPKGKGK